MKKVKIALLGLGNVGKGVLSIIRENKEQIVKRSGYEVDIAKILVRDKDKDRGIEITSEILTKNYDDILDTVNSIAASSIIRCILDQGDNT